MANINIRLVLYAAADVKTRKLKIRPTQSWNWDSMLDMARKQLQPDGGDVLRAYQESLLLIEQEGKDMLEKAKEQSSE